MFSWFARRGARKHERPEINKAPSGAAISRAQSESHATSAAHKTCGDECFDKGAVDEAADCYRKAIAADPGFAQAHCRLADAFKAQGKLNEAISGYRKALELSPNLADAHFGLGVCLLERSDPQNARVCFENAVGIRPDFVRAHNSIGFALLELGRPAEALARFQKALAIEPENGMARHLAAALSGSHPVSAPGEYVEKLFDGFAATFDAELRSLKYETPRHLVELVVRQAGSSPGPWRVLDLGCGTGLVGVAMAPHASELVGVDLSAQMLEKARARNLYQRLERLDLLAMMRQEAAASYDVVMAADTFIYLGNLDGVAREARRLLRPGGYFVFSAEALEALPLSAPGHGAVLDYCLQAPPSCRYAHSSAYISRLAADHGFTIHELQPTDIRMSGGSAIKGYLALWGS